MDQILSIQKIQDKIRSALKNDDLSNSEDTKTLLEEINHDLEVFHDTGIDFKDVVDILDESIFIADKDGKVLYVNPAYERNTGIKFDLLKGRLVKDIVEEGSLFTGGATLSVLEDKKRVFKLATINISNPPRMGYAIGVPLMDGDELKQVVVSSRPIHTLRELHKDYELFLNALNEQRESSETVSILDPSNGEVPLSQRLVGTSTELQNVWNLVRQVASTDATVLITGESGTGKEVIADELYRLGLRSDKPFVKVNCASIPANLLESELFGYEKGAFSGASTSGKKGLFEMANHGTLLLDEIGDMPLDLQVKLLRAIQNKEITRVGGTVPIPLDVRFIAATNSDLLRKVADGEFRQDLYYRLSVIPINMPPLRNRLDDLEELTQHFLNSFAKKHNRSVKLTPEALAIMKSYDWPGNMRELENIIEYLTICNSGSDTIDIDMLKNILHMSDIETQSKKSDLSLADSIEQHEIDRIKHALANTNNLREAGAMLGVNASTVSRKIRQYGIPYDKHK